MKKITVGLVQVNSAFSGQHYFPYSVGILQAYAEKHLPDPERFKFLPTIYRRVRVTEAAEQLAEADIAAFSVYVWNVRFSLAVAAELKRRRPETLVVFGGPQVPRADRLWEIERFFADNPSVDIAVHGAGERPFAAVLEYGLAGDWRKIPSASFKTRNECGIQVAPGIFQTEQAIAFKEDLNEIPSPYVSGVFDPLMAANPEERWIGLWETDRNCPFSCAFCGWGLLENKLAVWSMEHVFKDIDWFADRKVAFVFCANANFFINSRDLEIVRYVAKAKREKGFPKFLSVQDSKNRAEQVFKGRMIMEEAGLNTGVVISLQAVDPAVLKTAKRSNIKLEAYRELQHRFRAEGIETMTDMILPLAGQTYGSFAEGISEVIDHGQHNRIQFNLCCVVPDAEMSHRDYMAKYGLETVRTKIVNVHGCVENEEIAECQDLVVATDAMPRSDWVKARVFAWTAGLLHFDKLFQIPIVTVRRLGGASYREIFEFFSESQFWPAEDFPILTRIARFFRDKAEDIQRGGTEYVHSREWLDIYWPADEYVFIELVVRGELEAFYTEAEAAVRQLLAICGKSVPEQALQEAVRLNAALIKRPFQNGDLEVEFSSNIWGFYQGVVSGKEIAFVGEGKFHCAINRSEQWSSWEDWFRQVVWYGNKRGAYFYGNAPTVQFSGHY